MTTLLTTARRCSASAYDIGLILFKFANFYSERGMKKAQVKYLEQTLETIDNSTVKLLDGAHRTKAEEIIAKSFKTLYDEYSKDPAQHNLKKKLINKFGDTQKLKVIRPTALVTMSPMINNMSESASPVGEMPSLKSASSGISQLPLFLQDKIKEKRLEKQNSKMRNKVENKRKRDKYSLRRFNPQQALF